MRAGRDLRVDAGVVAAAAVCRDGLGPEGSGLADRRRDAPSTASWGSVGPGSDSHLRGTVMVQRCERGVFRVAGRAGGGSGGCGRDGGGDGGVDGAAGAAGGSPGVETPTSARPLGDGALRDDIIEGTRS